MSQTTNQATNQPTPSSPAERRRGLHVLSLSILCLGMGQSLFFAVLPPIARELNLSEVETGIIFSLSAALWIICSPFWGRRSDFLGRKPILLIGMSGFALSTLLFTVVIYMGQQGALSPVLLLLCLMGARAFFGGFGSGALPAAQGYVADRTPRNKRAQSIASLTAAFGIGNIIGPGIAASLIIFGFFAPFIAVALLSILATISLAFFLPERIAPKSKAEQRMTPPLAPPKGVLRPFITIGLMVSFAQATIIQLSAFHFIDRLSLGTDEATQMIGVGLMVMAMATLFGQLVIIQRFDLSVQTIMRFGSVAMAFSFIGLAIGQDYGVLVGALAIAGFGFGLLRPGLMAATSLAVGKTHQGAAAGFLNSTGAFGHMVYPVTGMLLYQSIPSAPFFVAAGLMVLVLVIVLFHPAIRAVKADMDPDIQPVAVPHHHGVFSLPEDFEPHPSSRLDKNRRES